MNEEALKLTEETGKVLFSRTKDRIWLKVNLLKIFIKNVKKKKKDCDDDTH